MNTDQVIAALKAEMKRLRCAFGYSIDGLRAVFASEPAFRIECAATAILIPLALLLPINILFVILLIASVLLVLIVELLNSAIEAAVDRASPDVHPLAKKAKDAASAAVLIALVNAGLVWALILWAMAF